MIHTLILLYLGGVIAEVLEQAGHWRAFKSVSRTMSVREDIPETMPELGLAIGIFVGVAAFSLVNGFKWPYRLTRNLWKSRIGHTSLGDEVLEFSMRMSFLQAVADYHRIDARMSIHEARCQLGDTYSAVMEGMEKILAVTVPGLRPPIKEYVPPGFGEPVFQVRPPTQEELEAAGNGFAIQTWGPPQAGPVMDSLSNDLASLRQEFPDSTLREVRAERSLGERSPSAPEVAYGSEQSWDKMTWTVQIGNERAHGDSMEIALAELRENLRLEALRPEYAQRVAAVLREIPNERFERIHALGEAQRLLDEERRAEWLKGDA